MDRTRLRKVGALFVAGVLFLIATPATASTSERTQAETHASLSLVDALPTWLTFWWVAAPIGATSDREVTDAQEGSAVPARGGGEATPELDPTANPQLGSEADPNG